MSSSQRKRWCGVACAGDGQAVGLGGAYQALKHGLVELRGVAVHVAARRKHHAPRKRRLLAQELRRRSQSWRSDEQAPRSANDAQVTHGGDGDVIHPAHNGAAHHGADEPAVGFHNAPWRSQFGGNIYTWYGSHDLGHTPFGHAGERFLNDAYHAAHRALVLPQRPERARDGRAGRAQREPADPRRRALPQRRVRAAGLRDERPGGVRHLRARGGVVLGARRRAPSRTCGR